MEENLYRKALKRVNRKKNLAKDIFGFLSTSLFLIAINLFTNPSFLWCVFPIGFYFLSILVSYFDFIKEQFVDDWEEGQVEKEYKKLLRKNSSTFPEGEGLDLEEMRDRLPKWNERDFV